MKHFMKHIQKQMFTKNQFLIAKKYFIHLVWSFHAPERDLSLNLFILIAPKKHETWKQYIFSHVYSRNNFKR